ncbi:MAG: histidine triad nucleotide-binding protein [Micrococcales bacterium]|nr:MAG: histidine triad nucleotide-binding protein [Micrococcales bacterium]
MNASDGQGGSECLFCQIAAGEMAADIVHRTDTVVAFRDIDPKAPTHVLVIPVEHGAGGDLLVDMAQVATAVGEAESPAGWRWVFNSGLAAGQSVFHVHGHVLGGRELAWPPG